MKRVTLLDRYKEAARPRSRRIRTEGRHMRTRSIARIVTFLLVAAGQVAGSVDWRDPISGSARATLDCCCGTDCACTGGCCDHTADSSREAASKRGNRSSSDASLAALRACRFPTAATSQNVAVDRLTSISSNRAMLSAPDRSAVTCAHSSLILPRDDRPSHASPRAPPVA
jgi:hypothetical protein